MRSKFILIAALLLLPTLFAKAQTPPAPAMPCMSDEQLKQFDFFVGEWDAFVTGTQTLVGHSVIERVSGGCAILENWAEPNGGSGKSLNYIDVATHKWKQTWIGSQRKGQQDFVDGEYKDGAMRFTFERTGPQGVKLTGRFIFYNHGPHNLRQFKYVSAH
jgi:hypothetical protein